MKRKRAGNDAKETPTKRTRAAAADDLLDEEQEQDEIAIQTPSRRNRSAKPPTISTPTKSILNGRPKAPTSTAATPQSKRKVLFETPSKQQEELEDEATPTTTRNADRSARRKSSRRLIERTLAEDGSEDDVSEDDLAREILNEDDEEEDDEEEELVDEETQAETGTPSKPRRGRPNARRRKRSPTPPENLPPHEQYFWHNKPGGTKTSDNKLPSDALLNHDEYFQRMLGYVEPHQKELDHLLSLHARSYEQWIFELECDFNICLYGYGSKRQLLTDFASYVHSTQDDPPKIIITNGYAPGITIRDILNTIAGVLLPKHLQLPTQPQALLDIIHEALSAPVALSSSKKRAHSNQTARTTRILLLINSIDSSSLRRPTVQSLLASLSSHPQISLLATADTLNFPLLWDTSLRSTFRFLFHDCTTFVPYTAEIEVVESVNELLGRSSRRIGGKDGVAFVLRSLPANARALFRVLVAEQVAAAAEGDDFGGEEGQAGAGADMDEDRLAPSSSRRPLDAGVASEGVEYRLLYRKAHEELICTNENGFRTLLKEFFDHQMVESRRDTLGSERLVVPFRKEELEGLLEELVD
ncbi:ORC2-domain-containing protein [Rhizodiscina lignyota]|uniref:Origin recognition complex subunit 2 n=1 Tax=Rhizodiscina lignyota TaxID=1504668 RepID=A0A9P4I6E0_9PEZI|nr:ORC2-domain-containing protein [Rhizodiscina lignyota]